MRPSHVAACSVRGTANAARRMGSVLAVARWWLATSRLELPKTVFTNHNYITYTIHIIFDIDKITLSMQTLQTYLKQ